MQLKTEFPFFYAAHDLSRLLKRRVETASQHLGLTMPQWRVLGQLSQSNGLSQSALAGLIESDPMTVSGMIERLEAKGLVSREPDPADSRAKIVTLTNDAHGLMKEIRVIAHRIHDEALAGISDSERETALNVLTRVSENLAAPSAREENVK
jgi:MarR family transcriptional regulator, transcriptional regulator for hemolysin